MISLSTALSAQSRSVRRDDNQKLNMVVRFHYEFPRTAPMPGLNYLPTLNKRRVYRTEPSPALSEPLRITLFSDVLSASS